MATDNVDDVTQADAQADASAVDTATQATEPVESVDDGGDVAGRDPEEIAHEIEQTRAELADTIDAIANRVSPKRAVSRGAQSVKAQVGVGKAKAADTAATVKEGVAQAASSAAQATSSAAQAASGAVSEATSNVTDTTATATAAAADRAAAVSDLAQRTVASSSGPPVMPIAAMAGVAVVILLVLRRRRAR